jgi:hypothetical protein
MLRCKTYCVSMSAFRETEKPFEKFVRIFLYAWLATALIFGFLLLIGIIKPLGKMPAKRTATAINLPENLEPRLPSVSLRED